LRVAGIDPGTKSFDIAVIEGPRVVAEESIETSEIARNPHTLIEALKRLEPDLVVAPSGYGVPPTWSRDVVDPHRFAVEVLLLSTDEAIEEGVSRGDPGAYVYRALALIVEEMHRMGMESIYIPSTVLLPTVPTHRKINRIDMGTADKLAVTALAVYDQSRRLGIGVEDTSFILVEMGFGYNAIMVVEGGRVVDGFGGTSSTIGFLTAGPLDLEVVVAGETWRRTDVFHGGVADACRCTSIDEALKAHDEGVEPCRSAVEAMVEGIAKCVAMALAINPRPREILLSGRYSRSGRLLEMVRERIERVAQGIEVRRLGLLEGARMSKEAAQGYAIVGEGLAGGFFSYLVRHMGIDRACGTVMDWVIHPAASRARERVRRAYVESVKSPKLCEYGGGC